MEQQDSYLYTDSKLEKDAASSIAVSLKRIADAQEHQAISLKRLADLVCGPFVPPSEKN